MIFLAALKLALAKVPAIIWAILIVVALLAGSAFALVKHGEHVEQRKASRAARLAATQTARLEVAHTRAKEDKLIRQAAETKPAAAIAGVRRSKLRSRVSVVDSEHVTIDGALTAAPPVLVALVQADDEKIRADSVHLVPLEALPEATRQTRAASVRFDSLLTKQADDAAKVPTHHTRDIAIGAGVALVAVAALFHFAH